MVEDRFEPDELLEGDFAGVHWPGVDLSKGRLRGIDLAAARLANADLTWVTCNGATFRNATLHGATLEDVTASGADFVGADLVETTFEGAGLASADLTDADLTDADFTDAWLRHASLDGATLEDATFSGAYLPQATLTDADLRGADFSDATLRGVDLTGANLDGANFDGANLDGASLPEERASLADTTTQQPDQSELVDEYTSVGEKAVALLVENGYGSRENMRGCTDDDIRALETERGIELPAAYRSCLRYIGESAGRFPVGSDFHCDKLHEVARETAQGYDAFEFAYADTDFVFYGTQGYTFEFFSTRDGPDPPVFNHMSNEGPRKQADSFSEWLFWTIER